MHGLREVYFGQATSPEHGEHWSGPPELVDGIAAVVGTHRGHAVLDVGCGVGGPARRLEARVGCRVVGIDLVAEVLALARRRHRRPDLIAADALRLPFDEASFDQVWCLGAIAHFPDLRAFAHEAERVTRTDGSVVLTEVFWDGRRRPRFAATAPAPWRPVTTATAIVALKDAGFEDARVFPWPGRDLTPDETVAHPALREDLLDARLRSALLVATKGKR